MLVFAAAMALSAQDLGAKADAFLRKSGWPSRQQLTSALTLQLAEQGKLDPHDSIRKYNLEASAGSLYSTVNDLLKWDWALEGGAVITAASKSTMWTRNLDKYGYGAR